MRNALPVLVLLAAVLMLAARPASALTTTTVVDLRVGTGTVRFLYVRPEAPLATIVNLAGGAGFLLAAALLVPGSRPRSEALRENGRRAIRLVAASTVLLLIAGTLEGFVSPIETWPLAWKLAVSAATAVFLVIYLSGGRARVRPPQPAETSEPSGLLGLGAAG